MSGEAVIWYLLKTKDSVLAVVSADKIMCGDIPVGTDLPAISIMQIGSNQRRTVSMKEATRLNTGRIQVTVLTKSYAATKALLKLLPGACPNTHGSVNGIAVDSILPDPEGPDFSDADAGIYGGTRDFMVKWSE